MGASVSVAMKDNMFDVGDVGYRGEGGNLAASQKILTSRFPNELQSNLVSSKKARDHLEGCE